MKEFLNRSIYGKNEIGGVIMGMLYITYDLSKKDWVGNAKKIQRENIDIEIARLTKLKETKSRRDFLPSEQVEYEKLIRKML